MLLEAQVAEDLRLEEITSADEAEHFRNEWDELWMRCSDATPFQSPDWQLAWWNAFGDGKELCIFALRERETQRLAALLPTCNLPNESKLIFVGAGISDELDLLAAPEIRAEAARIFVSHIREQRHRWSMCDLEPLPESSRLRSSARAIDVTPVLDPAAPLPAKLQRNIRNRERRAAKLGSFTIERASFANFDELFAALIRLHRIRWERRGERGVLCDPAVQRFHAQAARGLLRRGILRLYVLRIASEIVAAFYGFLHRGRIFYYIGGFEPEFDKLSLGTLLIAHAIDEARRAGAREFSFLRGAEPYKYLWGAKDRHVYSRRLIG